eukprot:TRINITY_DN2764_c0_g1_i1.p1 TRINITY_DN2764_c0_g1~~TRINITY_DN2764_c0_g1_i1.p1  ORF type:complete len:722 (+),score=180.88 TRINITY_DN2764_c0_g1_i1:122-2167(+)
MATPGANMAMPGGITAMPGGTVPMPSPSGGLCLAACDAQLAEVLSRLGLHELLRNLDMQANGSGSVSFHELHHRTKALLIGYLIRTATEHEYAEISNVVREMCPGWADGDSHAGGGTPFGPMTPQRTSGFLRSASFISTEDRLLARRQSSPMPSETSATAAGLQQEIDQDLELRLQVTPCNMDARLGRAIAPRKPGTLRLLQWNVLADGLSQDGYSVAPVKKQWPCARDHLPAMDGSSAPAREVIRSVLGVTAEVAKLRDEALARAVPEDRDDIIASYQELKLKRLQQIKAQFDTIHAQDNLRACMDWDGRRMRLLWFIARTDPDIICLQEVDHLCDLQRWLQSLGYSCGKQYLPRHLLNDYVQSFCQQRPEAAFAPKVASESLILKLERLFTPLQLSEACEALMGKPMGRKPYQKLKDLVRDKEFIERGGLPAFFSALASRGSAVDSCNVDDDGSVIFWKKSLFNCERIDVLGFGKPGSVSQGAVKVALRERRGSGRSLSVITTHLKSGNRAEQEEARVRQLTEKAQTTDGGSDGLLGWFQAAAAPAILSMDGNSRPQFPGEATVWKRCKAAGLDSVWDDYFGPDGAPKVSNPPVTVNKLRGPGSAQPQKIGEHAYEMIDHVFSRNLPFQGFAFASPRGPVVPSLPPFASKTDALDALLPSLEIPSDHYPVVVDFAWPDA